MPRFTRNAGAPELLGGLGDNAERQLRLAAQRESQQADVGAVSCSRTTRPRSGEDKLEERGDCHYLVMHNEVSFWVGVSEDHTVSV